MTNKTKKRCYYIILVVLYSLLMFIVSDLVEMYPLDGKEYDELEE